MQRVRLSAEQAPAMSLSPKFSRSAIRSSLFDPSSEVESFLRGEPLIPGLPDDVALNCLLRLPIPSHAACRAVCKSWYLVLGDKERFFSRRKELGLEDPWLFVFASHKCTGKIQWQALDLVNFSWHTIPAMPCKDKAFPYGLRCSSLPKEGTLFVCGGMLSDLDCPLDSVLKYEILKNRWTVMDKMTAARSFFASGVINGRIYVAGGMSVDFFELASGEVFDPVDGTWREIASMGTSMASYDAAVLNGKLLVTEGWSWPFYVSPRGRVYNPVANKWENMSVKLRDGWTGSSAVVYGHLFVVVEFERMKLKVYDEVRDSWEAIDGPPLPWQICKPFAVSAHGRTIYVVGRNLSVALGRVSMLKPDDACGKKCRFSISWQVIDAPDDFLDLTPLSSQVLIG